MISIIRKLILRLVVAIIIITGLPECAKAIDTSEAMTVVPHASFGAAEVPFLFDYIGKQTSIARKATCRVSYDKDSIRFYVTIPIKSSYKPIGLNERDGVIWGDDRIEVFLQPNGKGSFYQYILNAAGAIYDARDRDKSWNGTPECNVKINANSWQANIRVPYSNIGFDPANGNIIKGNVAVASNEPGNTFVLTWVQMPIDFLAASSFGTWKLSSDQPFVEKITVSDVKYNANGAYSMAEYVVNSPSNGKKTISKKVHLAYAKTAVMDLSLDNFFAYKTVVKNDIVPDIELIALDPYNFTISLRNIAVLARFSDRVLLAVDGKKVLNCRIADISKKTINCKGWVEGNHQFSYKFTDKSGKIFAQTTDTIYTFKPVKCDYDISELDASRYYPSVNFTGKKLSAALCVFDLSEGILPNQVSVNNIPVLDKGVQIVFDGKGLPLNGKVEKISANKNEVKLVSVSHVGDKTITIRASHDYDGFTWYDVSIKSAKSFEYGSLKVELPMKLNSDVILNHDELHYDELFGKARVIDIGAPTDLRDSSYDSKYLAHGRLLKESENLTLPLTSFVSLATDTDGRYRGLGFCTEGPVGWNISNYDNTFSIARIGKERATLTANISDGKKGIHTKEIKFSFGLQPYPTRISRNDFHADYRMDSTFYLDAAKPHIDEKTGKTTDFFERVTADGVTMELSNESWTVLENYWKAGSNEAAIEKYVEGAKRAGLGLVFYFGFNISNKIPEFPLYHDLVLRKPNDYPEGGFRHYVHYKQGEPDQCGWGVCYKSIWADRFAQGITDVVRRYNLRGVYYDGTLIPGGCANGKHDCGTVDPYGRLVVTFPVRAYRRLGEIIYNSCIKIRPDFIIDLHVAWPYPPAMGLVESYYAGETAHLFEPATSRTSPESLRGMLNGRLYGVPCDFLRRPETSIYTAWAQSLLVDTYPRLTEGGGEIFTYLHRHVWEIYDKYQLTSDTFTPYWVKVNKIAKDNPDVFISYYETDKAVVTVVSAYWCNQNQTVTVDFGAFKGLKTLCHDAFSQKNYEIMNGKLKLDVTAQNLALLVIEKQ